MADSKGSETAVPAVISRRDAIMGALALAAGTLIASKPDAALAADGDPLLRARINWCSTTTTIARTDTGAFDGVVESTVQFNWDDFTGTNYSVYAYPGSDDSGGSAGIVGEARNVGQYGVIARSLTGGGNGLRAYAPDGIALEVVGPTMFSRSGLGTILKGKSKASVSVAGGLTSSSLILVTLQGSAGAGIHVLYAKKIASSATKFEVFLSKAATAKVNFAWMILN